MEPTTKTIAYNLRVPAPTGTAASTADRLVAGAADLGANIVGSHVDATAGVLRFRAADDSAAIGLALALVGTESKGCTLTAGFGVHARLVAES
jgi:hypothetical protein